MKSLAILLLTLSVGLTINKAPVNEEHYLPSVTLSSEGNSFSLSDYQFEVGENFAFTSRLIINDGQAAGLVFGGNENEHYYVFNIDRYENKTKLLEFSLVENELTAQELYSDYYIGNDKVTQSELNMINPRVRNNQIFDMKIVVSTSEEEQYIEFFIDNIKRFGIDTKITLSSLNYEGGYLGYYVFNSNTRFTETYVDEVESRYYSDTFRNQYHYSQHNHWNNDPNGMVYYNGYYHLFYQTNPFFDQWGDMYWGHARSKDLIHWQELPIALFPDDATNHYGGTGAGYAWSGIAMVYHQGMSSVIDAAGWFTGESGLLGYYTRDGWNSQDQVIITSNDEGLTWEKRVMIPQSICISGNKQDCRDPGVFKVNNDTWGMTLSSQGNNKVWFLKSQDLVNWSYAGEFNFNRPECVSISKIKDKNNQEKTLMVVMSRSYTVGEFSLNGSGNIVFTTIDGQNLSTMDANKAFKNVEYGEDSYASQTFYIDDTSSEYYGESVVMNWFSGVPADAEAGHYEKVRDHWNGGGFTIPVKFGLDENNELTQTPITKNNAKLEKTNVINIENETMDSIKTLDVNTHSYEVILEIDNPNNANVEFVFNKDQNEQTSFGYEKDNGYFVDRTKTSSSVISFGKTYNSKYITGEIANHNKLTFYGLIDRGSLELFAQDGRYAFYNLLLSNKAAKGVELITDNAITITKLEINEVHSIWTNKEHNREFDFSSSLSFDESGIIGGGWYMDENQHLVGEQYSGDGFIMSKTIKDSFSMSVTADVTNAAAFGIVFNAKYDLNSYIVFNYDKNANVSKVWDKHNMLATESVTGVDVSNVTLSLEVKDNSLNCYVNGKLIYANVFTDKEHLSGHIGLNVFSGSVTFKNVNIFSTSYEFANTNLEIEHNGQTIDQIINVTKKNTIINRQYYTTTNDKIIIDKQYFSLLDENTTYDLLIKGKQSTYHISVKVNNIVKEYHFNNLEVEENDDVNIYVGSLKVESVSINGTNINNYFVKDYILHINHEELSVGDNEVIINETYTFTISVKGLPTITPHNENVLPIILGISIPSVTILLGGMVVLIIVLKKKKGGKHV